MHGKLWRAQKTCVRMIGIEEEVAEIEGKWGAGLERCPRDAQTEHSHSRWRCGDHTVEGTQAGIQIRWSVPRA